MVTFCFCSYNVETLKANSNTIIISWIPLTVSDDVSAAAVDSLPLLPTLLGLDKLCIILRIIATQRELCWKNNYIDL